MLLNESASVAGTNVETCTALDTAGEQRSYASTSDHKSSLSIEETNPSPKRFPRCRHVPFLAKQVGHDIVEHTKESLQPNPQAVVTPSLGIQTISNYSTSTTHDCFLRDPESLLLSIINMATSSPPQTSTQKYPPIAPSSIDSCQVLEQQVLESLPHLSSLQMSPIPERRTHSLRPTTAIDSQCDTNMLFIRKKHKFTNYLADFSRCMSAKAVVKHPDSIFDSELESSCITPRFLHAISLRGSPSAASQAKLNEDSRSNKQTVSTCSPHLRYLTHIESSAISTVESLNSSSSCTTVTPTAPLSARLPSLASLNAANQQTIEPERAPSHVTLLHCADMKTGIGKRQTQLAGPVPLLALPRSSGDAKDNICTSRSLNEHNVLSACLDIKEPDSRHDSGSYSKWRRDSDGFAGTSAKCTLSLEKNYNITHLKLPTVVNEAGKSSVRSTTDNIHLDLTLPECSSARYDPSTRQLEQSVQNFEPDQLCILNPHIKVQEPALETLTLQPLVAVATHSSINETSMLSSLHLADVILNPKSEAAFEENCLGGNIDRRRCKSTPSSRSHVRPMPCHDPIFDAASYKALSESENSFAKLEIVGRQSLGKVHTSLLTHDSSTGYGPCVLSKSLSSTISTAQERPRKYLITSGRISITPARKNLKISLIQLNQLFDDTLVVSKTEENKRCHSSGSTRVRNTGTSCDCASSMYGSHSHRGNNCSIALTPIAASSRGPSRSSERAENSTAKQRSCMAGSRSSSCHTTKATSCQRKATSTPGPRLQLGPIIQKETSTSLVVKHAANVEPAHRIGSGQQHLKTNSRNKSANENYREDIRQAMMRMCLSNADVDKYRTLSVQQRLRGLHPLVRGSKAISDD